MFDERKVPARCQKYEAQLEDYLGGAADPEMDEHLIYCEGCRAALDDSRLAGDLLREAWEPAGAPSRAFLASVMLRIRAEEARAKTPAAFWAPFELLASRLSLTAAVLLLALSVYLAKFAPSRGSIPFVPNGTELSATDLPQPPGDPVSNDDILVSLSERNYGR